MEEKKGVKYRILFVCLGNICRSPAAEGIMKHIIKERGLEDIFYIDSAGMIGHHSGESADPRMIANGKQRGYNFTSISRKFNPSSDFESFDYIIGMDGENIKALQSVSRSNSDSQKITLMTDYCIERDDSYVPDPYYGGEKGFQNVINILEDACEGLLKDVINNNKK